MSKTLVVVGCGAAKRDGPTVAKDLYTSTYFQKKREFAEQRGDFWQILSAEHGLISPELEVAPYDTTISDLTDGELDQLAHEVGMDLIDWMAAHEIDGETVDEIIVLAGKSYIDPLREREAFAAGIDERVSYPLQENDLGGIGEQMAWLGDRAAAGGEQSKLVTDGGTELGIECDVDGCETHVVGLDDGWEMDRGTVCQDCIDYRDRHGHWPDEDVEICVECRIDDGMINHDCDEFSGDGVLLDPGGECSYCGYEAPMTDGGARMEANDDEVIDEDVGLTRSGLMGMVGKNIVCDECGESSFRIKQGVDSNRCRHCENIIEDAWSDDDD